MVRFGLGLMTLQRPPGDPTPWSQVYGDTVDLARAAEAAGFDSIWLSEHHFTDDGYLSALFPLLGALSLATERLMLGTSAMLAPLHQPLRLVEDAVAVQLLSRGRLVLGLALGYRDEEFELLGAPRDRRVGRLLDAVELLRAACDPQRPARFDHRGRTVAFEGLALEPRPEVTPPVWLGGWSQNAMRRAARHGDGCILAAGGLDDVTERVRLIEDERRRAGLQGRFGYQLPLFGWIGDGEPPAELTRGMEHLLSRYGEWYSSSSDLEGGRAVGEMVRALQSSPEAIDSIGFVHGDADEWIRALRPYEELFGAGEAHVTIRLTYPGMPAALSREAIERFGRQVVPAFR